MMSGPRLLKWLCTRRLWDVQARQYVTFDGVRDWLSAGNEVRVTEQETNLDVTRELLLKVVLHDQQRGARLFTKDVLLALIRIQGTERRRQVRQYLDRLAKGQSRTLAAQAHAAPRASADPLMSKGKS
jgi:polyhydroxyalkanoate synthesis repressor PhaR